MWEGVQHQQVLRQCLTAIRQVTFVSHAGTKRPATPANSLPSAALWHPVSHGTDMVNSGRGTAPSPSMDEGGTAPPCGKVGDVHFFPMCLGWRIWGDLGAGRPRQHPGHGGPARGQLWVRLPRRGGIRRADMSPVPVG